MKIPTLYEELDALPILAIHNFFQYHSSRNHLTKH